MIDLTMHEERLQHAIDRAKERNILIPTFAQMQNPALIPENVKKALKNVGLWDVNPLNLFRISWHNEPTMQGGGFGGVNFIELPSALTGVDARIIVMCGKWFPTGCHKVGASFGWHRALLPASSTQRITRPFGPPRATIAAAAHIIQSCSAAIQ